MHILAALVLLYVGHGKEQPLGAQAAVVAHLAAHLGVQGGAVQHYDGFSPGGDFLAHFAVGHDSENLGLGLSLVIALENGLGDLLAEADAGPAQVAQGGAGLAGADTLLLHQLLEALLVHVHALVGAHLDGQVDGEAVGIIKLERISAGEGALPFCLVFGKHVIEDLHARINGLGKILFLCLYHAGDVGLLFPQFGILALVLVDNRIDDLVQQGLVHAQELAVASCPTQKTAQHIAPALVGRQHSIADHEGGGTDMVGNDTQRHVHLMALAVVGAGELADLMGDIHHRVHIEERVHILAHHSQTLQAHTGIDVLLLEFSVMAFPVIVKLGEDVVPDLNITVAVAANRAAGLSAAVLFTAVVVDLRAGAAGACAMLPEVILLAEAEDALRGNADLLVPDIKSLVVIHIDGWIEAVGIQTYPIGAGQEFPAPVNGFALEVIAEGEIAQHLKIGAMAGSFADVFDIAGADALLAGADPVPGRLLLALEIGLHGRHAGVDQEKACVSLGDQREAGKAKMSLSLEELQKHFAQLVESVLFHVFVCPLK